MVKDFTSAIPMPAVPADVVKALLYKFADKELKPLCLSERLFIFIRQVLLFEFLVLQVEQEAVAEVQYLLLHHPLQ